MSVKILSDSSKNIVTENGTRSPYEQVIFNSSCSNAQGGSMFHTTSFPTSSTSSALSTSSSPLVSSSRYTLPGHSYSAPVLPYILSTPDVKDSKSQSDQQKQNDDGGITVSLSEKRPLLSDLPKISTNLTQESSQVSPSIFPNIKPQHQRVASDDDSLATLPSPATSLHDFPIAHHVKHVPPIRKISSLSLNSDVKSHSEGHFSDNDDIKGNNHYTSDEIGSISNHHTLKQRLLKLGLAETAELIGHYAILKTIGEGGFSEVKLAMDLNNCRQVAIKMIATKGIQDNQRLMASVLREVDLLKYIDHQNIVGLLDTVETETHLCLILEYVSGGELFYYLQDHYEDSNEEESKYIFLQLVKAIEYLHENKIVHRDLKLENILMDPSSLNIKLTDFGLAKFIDTSSPNLTTRCGSEEYAAPELLAGRPYDGRKTDLWSLGIILYALLVGYLPFNLELSQSRKQFYSKIIRVDFTFPDKSKEGRKSTISNEAKDLVKRILHNNPQKRLALNEIKKHPWLKDVNV